VKTIDGDNLTHDYYGYSTWWTNVSGDDEQDTIVRPVLAWIDGGCVGKCPDAGAVELAVTSGLVREIVAEPRFVLTAKGHSALLVGAA
jgi:hypothetical protein